MEKGSLNDPQKMAEDVSESGHWENGDYRIIIHDVTDITDMEYLMLLIMQSLKQLTDRVYEHRICLQVQG